MLTWITFLPLIGALLVVLAPSGATRLLRLIALGTTIVTAGLGAILFASFQTGTADVQFAVDRAWFELPGGVAVNFRLGVDGLSILMVALTTFLMPFIVLSTYGHITERVKEFLVWLLVMQTGMLGVFVALDLVLFYFFWEVSLVPLYFIVGIWGGERRLYATLKFFLYTLAGSLVMLVGVISLLYRFRGTGAGSDVLALTDLAAAMPAAEQLTLFAAFALAFAIKVPVIPFHTWLADAHTEAPTSGSVILAGVLLKMGTYGLLRFGVAMFPGAAVQAAPLLMGLGAIGIVYGAFLAMAQNDLKRLVACSSVSHLGFVVLGLFALTEAGVTGSVLQMVNHGLSTGLLFLLVGMIYERRHTRALDQFGGLAAVMPVFAIFFVVTVLSSVGLPGLNGFVGEYLILLGSFQSSPVWAAIGVTGVIFGAVYLLSATRRVLFGAVTREENRKLTDLNTREIGLMVPLVVLVVWIGVKPAAFLDRTTPSVERVVQRIEQARAVARGDADDSASPRVAHRGER